MPSQKCDVKRGTSEKKCMLSCHKCLFEQIEANLTHLQAEDLQSVQTCVFSKRWAERRSSYETSNLAAKIGLEQKDQTLHLTLCALSVHVKLEAHLSCMISCTRACRKRSGSRSKVVMVLADASVFSPTAVLSPDRSSQTRKRHKTSDKKSIAVKFSDNISEIWSSLMLFSGKITMILVLVDDNSCPIEMFRPYFSCYLWRCK